MSTIENSGERITLAEAIELVTEFRSRYPKEIKASKVSIGPLNEILDQPGCVGIRIYNGYDEAAQRISLVLVGIDGNNADMTSGVMIDRLLPCPPLCPPPSPLN